MAGAYITPKLFRFLKDLRENNDRNWFRDNKARYESDVRDPVLEFISDFAPRLQKLSPHLVADSRPVGGSMFRIYRDVRFSKDKSPYKTHVGVRFPHEDRKSVHAPGYYLHLEPGAVFAGGGVWRPESETLRSVRDAIVEDPKKWKRAISGKAFTARCELGGERLKRPPKGYDPDHPLIEVLKHKDFIASTQFTEKEACSKEFMKGLQSSYAAMKPLMAFLTHAVGAPW